MTAPKRRPGDWLAAAQAKAASDPQAFLGIDAAFTPRDATGYTVVSSPKFGKVAGTATFALRPDPPARDWFAEVKCKYADNAATFRAEYQGTFEAAEKPLTLADIKAAERELFERMGVEMRSETREMPYRRAGADLEPPTPAEWSMSIRLGTRYARDLGGPPRRTDCYRGRPATLSPDPKRAARMRDAAPAGAPLTKDALRARIAALHDEERR